MLVTLTLAYLCSIPFGVRQYRMFARAAAPIPGAPDSRSAASDAS
jgi:hypothetical protein